MAPDWGSPSCSQLWPTITARSRSRASPEKAPVFASNCKRKNRERGGRTVSRILLVDDDPNTLASLARAFRLEGHEATVCDTADRALDLARAHKFDIILSDVVMPGKNGIELLADLKTAGVVTPVVMISGQANVEMAVKATRLGAVDFLEKPLSTDKLLLTLENVVKLSRLEQENRDLRQRVAKHTLVWRSTAINTVMAQAKRVAASEARVCI